MTVASAIRLDWSAWPMDAKIEHRVNYQKYNDYEGNAERSREYRAKIRVEDITRLLHERLEKRIAEKKVYRDTIAMIQGRFCQLRLDCWESWWRRDGDL